MVRVRTRDTITKLVDKWVTRLAERNIEFVLSPEDLATKLYDFDNKFINHFKTQFKRTEINYVHPKLVAIGDVLSGNTKIWTDDEKTSKQRADNEENVPRGFDTNGDKETTRFLTFFKLFPKLSKRFNVTDTVRGSLVDIILTSIRDSSISFGLQIATSKMFKGGFSFNKTIAGILKCLEHNLFVLCIGMVDEQIVGIYLIPPTSSVKEGFERFKDSMKIKPRMMSHKQPSSELNQYLYTFRYINSSFHGGMKGSFKDLDEFSDDFLTLLCDNYNSVVNTTEHFSSLFISACDRTEWAGNRSFEMMNDTQELGLIQTLIHGARGDMKLKLKDEYELVDERKTLIVDHCSSKSWRLPLRQSGQQGMNPLIVNTITASVRRDRSNIFPSEPEDFIGFVFFPILTASGNLALRPDVPSACSLCLSCDTNNRDEWIRISIDKIGSDTYPEHMTEMIPGSKYIKIKAVFYYDILTKGSERWHDFLYLFRLFAKRVPTQDAIDAYNNAVTPELIDTEKQKLCRKSG